MRFVGIIETNLWEPHKQIENMVIRGVKEMLERRNLLKKVLGVLVGALVVGGCSQSEKRTNESSLFPHDNRKVERGIDRLVEDVN